MAARHLTLLRSDEPLPRPLADALRVVRGAIAEDVQIVHGRCYAPRRVTLAEARRYDPPSPPWDR